MVGSPFFYKIAEFKTSIYFTRERSAIQLKNGVDSNPPRWNYQSVIFNLT